MIQDKKKIGSQTGYDEVRVLIDHGHVNGKNRMKTGI